MKFLAAMSGLTLALACVSQPASAVPSSCSSGFSGNGSGLASAVPGILKASASVSASGFAFNSETASAVCHDNLIFNGGPAGTSGTVQLNPYFLSGSASASADSLGHGEGSGSLVITFTRRFDITIDYDNDAGTVNQVNTTNPVIVPPLVVVFGTSYAITYALVADALAAGRGGVASANADFSHTFLWPGISSVLDANGNPIAFTVTSDLGFDYSKRAVDASLSPIPEPDSFTVMLAGLALLGYGALRRKSRNPKFRAALAIPNFVLP